MSESAKAPLATRLALRFRAAILILGMAAGCLLIMRLLGLGVPDKVVVVGTAAVGAPAVILFCCATFDGRFHNALSVVNAERRKQARQTGLLARTTGLGLPCGDPALAVLGLALVALLVIANYQRDGFATALGFASVFLVGIANMASYTDGYPTDRLVG